MIKVNALFSYLNAIFRSNFKVSLKNTITSTKITSCYILTEYEAHAYAHNRLPPFILSLVQNYSLMFGYSIPAYGDYFLMTPTEAYSSFMEAVGVKCHMSKVIIEFLQDNQDATYEDLLNKLQVSY